MEFLSFEDVIADPDVLKKCKVVINVGDAYTAPSGGTYWTNPKVTSAVKAFVAQGGGLIGVGEPSACEYQGRYFTLANVLGVNKEVGFSMSTDKYNWEEHSHFITEESSEAIDFGEGMKNIYALSDAEVLKKDGEDVQMAVNRFGDGRSVYISGIPYSFENSRMLYRAIFWAAGMEQEMKKWYSSNYHAEVNYYPATGKYCIVNNTYEPQETVIYDGNGQACSMQLKANDILWFSF